MVCTAHDIPSGNQNEVGVGDRGRVEAVGGRVQGPMLQGGPFLSIRHVQLDSGEYQTRGLITAVVTVVAVEHWKVKLRLQVRRD